MLLEGVNDIGFPGAKIGESVLADPAEARMPEELIDADRQLIVRAHARGVKVGATIGPFEGVDVRFASPDHLHPNDAGYQAMADAMDPRLFR